jgi:hypothetical protein
MEKDITDKTKNFVNQVNSLVDSGTVRNREEIISKLKWSKSYMSQVMALKKNVPPPIYKKFTEVYEQPPINTNNMSREPLEIAIESLSASKLIDSKNIERLIVLLEFKLGVKPDMALFNQPGTPLTETGTHKKTNSGAK